MTGDVHDDVFYGRRVRLRLAVADQAADIADLAATLVPTGTDDARHAGDYVDTARRLVDDVRELLTLAVALERGRGTSWEVIGEMLGISRQAAHERYASLMSRVDEDIIEAWLRGDDPHQIGLPEAAADPATGATRLDRWAREHRPDKAADRPVSDGLTPMTHTEHADMVTAATALLANRRKAGKPIDPTLERGHARRKVELYERMLADEAAQPGSTGTDIDELHDLRAGARTRLTDLEG